MFIRSRRVLIFLQNKELNAVPEKGNMASINNLKHDLYLKYSLSCASSYDREITQTLYPQIKHLHFFLFLRCRFFRAFLVPFPLSLCIMESTSYVRSFLPDGVFLPCDHGLDFFTSAYVRIQSINQPYSLYQYHTSATTHHFEERIVLQEWTE